MGGWEDGPGRFGGDPFQYMTMMMGMSSYLPSLVPQIALIWLSPLENHPYSIDALIFGRYRAPRSSPRPGRSTRSRPSRAETPLVIS